MLTIVPPVSPWRGTRGTDSWGSGVFGASRGGRQHAGLDFVAVVGDDVVAPFTGSVVHVGIAYPGSTLGSVHIQGDAEFNGWRAKLLYVRTDAGLLGRRVLAGDRIGDAQDVAAYWAEKEPGHVGTMVNHIHLEILVTEPRHIDPAICLPMNLIERPVTA